MPKTIILALAFLMTQFAENASGEDSEYAFDLPTTQTKSVSCCADSNVKGTLVFFFSTECPLAKLYSHRLNQLQTELGDRVRFIGVNSTSQDSMEDIKEFESELELSFPLAKDYDNKIADAYRATRTAEVVLLDARLNVVYRGRIDDQYSPGVSRASASSYFLRDAMESLIAGERVSVNETQAVGCLIGRVKKAIDHPTVTYTNQVSRLIQKNCVDCHRSGEIGPFSLEDYEEARGWAEMMVEVTENKRMPPWHATNQYLKFKNERFLSDDDVQIFRDWLAQGTPYGDASELPDSKEFTRGWRLPRQPDQIVEMRSKPFVVPADGTVEYQYFVVDPGFEEDKWISSAEVIPGNRSVVHHSIVYIRPPDGVRFRGIGWLAAYVPGQSAPINNPTHATFVPAGSKFVFQQHYTPTGTEQFDKTSIGIVFAESSKLTHEVYTLAALNQQFEIPANSSSHAVRSFVDRYPKNGEIIAMAPHMHYRGKSFRAFTTGNGKQQQLIDVPAYDFNWQHNYQPIEPISLGDIEEIRCEFEFDNSTGNPFNPDPEQTVTWGDQTWEEMAVAFFVVAEPIDSARPQLTVNKKTTANDVDQDKLDVFVADFFERFDTDQNSELIRDELPRSIRRFGFWQYDADSDGIVTREELRKYAASRFKK